MAGWAARPARGQADNDRNRRAAAAQPARARAPRAAATPPPTRARPAAAAAAAAGWRPRRGQGGRRGRGRGAGRAQRRPPRRRRAGRPFGRTRRPRPARRRRAAGGRTGRRRGAGERGGVGCVGVGRAPCTPTALPPSTAHLEQRPQPALPHGPRQVLDVQVGARQPLRVRRAPPGGRRARARAAVAARGRDTPRLTTPTAAVNAVVALYGVCSRRGVDEVDEPETFRDAVAPAHDGHRLDAPGADAPKHGLQVGFVRVGGEAGDVAGARGEGVVGARVGGGRRRAAAVWALAAAPAAAAAPPRHAPHGGATARTRGRWRRGGGRRPSACPATHGRLRRPQPTRPPSRIVPAMQRLDCLPRGELAAPGEG